MNISSIEASKVGAGKAGKRDKLAQTKLLTKQPVLAKPEQRERQLREAHKLDLQAKKTAKENSVAEQKEMLRQERMTHDTRRARADRRRMQASLAKAERGEEARCEHGFAHCKLCNMRG